MFLCEILTEAQQALPRPVGQIPPQQMVAPQQQVIPKDDLGSDEYDPELDGEEQVVEEIPPFQEILPMKRYYLIQKLNNLKTRMDQNNIVNEDFDIIVKFVNNISYNSLVSLSSAIIPVIEDQIARLINNGQRQ
jgi:hypothetical protein